MTITKKEENNKRNCVTNGYNNWLLGVYLIGKINPNLRITFYISLNGFYVYYK